jgi:hypothetical protein
VSERGRHRPTEKEGERPSNTVTGRASLYINIHIHTYTHTFIHMYVCTYKHTYIHCVYTYIHTYIHTYDRLKVFLKFVKVTNIYNTSYNLDIFKYFLVMFVIKKITKKCAIV